MTIPQKNKFLVFSSASFAIIVGSFFGLQSLTGVLTTSRTNIEQYRVDAELAFYQQENRQAIQAEYEQLTETTNQLASYFISERTVLDFISRLEQFAEDRSLSIQIQELNAPETAGGESPVALNVTGQYGNTLLFLEDLETADVYMSFTQISFSRGENAASTTMSVQAQLRWLP